MSIFVIFKNRILKSRFLKDLSILMVGSVLSQAIPLLVSPILTRIYTPGEFGIFASYMAFISIGSTFVTGRYQSAIILPKSDEIARYLAATSFFLALFSSVLLLVGFMFFSNIKNYFYFIPFGIFLFAFYDILIQWLNRKEQYKQMTINRAIQAISISSTQVLIGVIKKISLGLVISDIVGRVVSIIIIFKKTTKEMIITRPSFNKFIAIAKKYKKFPKYLMPSSLLNNFSYQLPYIMIPIIFSPTVGGFYFLVFRAIMSPISLISNSITEIFKNKATQEIRKNNSCKNTYKKLFLFLLIVGIVPTILLLFFAQNIFVFVFGSEWKEAGLYAQIFSPVFLLNLISSPLSFIFIIREKLKLNLIIQFLFCFLIVASLVFSFFIKNTLVLISLLSASSCFIYIIQIVISYRLSYRS